MVAALAHHIAETSFVKEGRAILTIGEAKKAIFNASFSARIDIYV